MVPKSPLISKKTHKKTKNKFKKEKSISKPKINVKCEKPEEKPKLKKEDIKKDNVLQVKNNDKKYVMPSKVVSEHIVDSCLKVLEQLSTINKKKTDIFDNEAPIFAEIHSIKIPNAKGNIKFILPHSTVASTGEICLITPDLKKGKRHDHEPTVDHWEEMLRKAGVINVKTVLPMRQLRVEYDQYELKRRLLTQHDFIMVDTRVLNHVSHLLGKNFFKKHNMLIPVRIDDKRDLKKCIDAGICTAMLRLNEGQTSTIQVGHTGMNRNDVKDNVISLIQQLRIKYPGGEANIRSISLKLPLSLSLPIYLTLRPSLGDIPKVIHKKPKHYMEVEDELSTIPGRKVVVAPDGSVRLKILEGKLSAKSSDDEDMEDDVANLSNE